MLTKHLDLLHMELGALEHTEKHFYSNAHSMRCKQEELEASSLVLELQHH